MKSIIARFQELKQNPLALKIEVEGEEVVANKVEAAIALAGVKLRDASGQFRNLDDVFLELAKSWDGLDRNTQRYIATIAAGSRQQSRFIALMEGYDRTLELTELAQDSEGQSAAQFLKTLDSLDSKLNKIKNSLEALYQKFVNSDFFGGLLDSLNNLIQGFSKWDGTTLAMFLTGGVVLGNQLVQGVKKALQGKNLFGAVGIATGAANFVNNNTLFNMLPKNRSLNNERNEIIEKYNRVNDRPTAININTVEANRQITNLENHLNQLNTKITEKRSTNIDTAQDLQELKELERQAELTRQEIDRIKGTNAYKATPTDYAYTRENDPTIQAYEQEMNEVDRRLQARAQGIKTSMVNTMSSIGPAMIGALSLGISQAINSDDPLGPILLALGTFAATQLPTIIQGITAVVAKGTAEITVAGGWVTIIMEAIALAIIALTTWISWAVAHNKSESQKLEEQIDKLKDKQKELQEETEKLNAEAAQEKTKNKKLDKLIDTYDELIKKTGRTTEENEKLNDTINDLATEFPDLIDYYDKAGNAVLKQRKEWESIIQLQKESTAKAMQKALMADLDLNVTNLQLQESQTKYNAARARERISDTYANERYFKSIGEYAAEYTSPEGQINSAAVSAKLTGGLNVLFEVIGDISKGNLNTILNDSKKEQIKNAVNNITDFSDVQQIESLRKTLAVINTADYRIIEGWDDKSYNHGSDGDTNLLNERRIKTLNKLWSTPATKLFQSTQEVQAWIDNLDVDDSYKQEIQKEFDQDKNAYLIKMQDLYNGITEQINALNPDYKSEEYLKELEKVRENLKKYFIQYVENFMPDVSEDFTEKGLQIFGEAYAEKQQEALTDKDVAEYIIGKTGTFNMNGGFVETLKDRFYKITGQSLSEAGFSSEEIQRLSDVFSQTMNVDGIKEIEKLAESDTKKQEGMFILTRIMSKMQAGEQQLFAQEEAEKLKQFSENVKAGNIDERVLEMINAGSFGLYGQELLTQFLNEVITVFGKDDTFAQKFQEYVDEQTKKIKNMPSGFRELGEKYGYDIAQGLLDKGATARQAEALTKELSSIKDQTKVNSILTMITAEGFDWGSKEGLIQLGTALREAGDSAKDAAERVYALKEILAEPINLTLNADKAVEDITGIAKSLSEMRKGFKDLNSAVEEFNENGRLSTETVLELLENGQLMYLQYNKETKAITIDKQAMADYFELQVTGAKLQMQMKKQEVQQSTAALKQRKINLQAQIKILQSSLEHEGQLTAEQYNALDTLNTTYDQDTLTKTSNFLTNLLSLWKTEMEGLTKIAAEGGANAHNALLKGFDTGELSVNTIDISGTQAEMEKILKDASVLIPEHNKKGYQYKLDTATVQAMIDKLQEEIKNTDDFIEANEKYEELIDRGIDTITALTESGLGKFLNDTASATKNASKELEDYISTLEKYYNLQKAIEKSSKETEKAKKTWERTGTLEDRKKYEDSLKKEAQQRSQLAANYTGERAYDLQTFKDKLSQKYNINPEMIAKIGLDENGYLDANVLREILNQSLETMDKDTFEKLDKDINEALKEIEGDTDKINEQKEWFDNLIETEKEKLEKVKELKASLDKMSNIDQALESINKNFEDAKEQNELYYESGGKEGIDTLQMARAYAERQEGLTKANTAIKATQQDFLKTDENYLKYKDYLTIGPDGKMYFDQDAFNKNFSGDDEEYAKITNAIKDIKEEYNKYTDKINENTKALDKNAKELKDWQKSLKKSYSDLITRLADDMAKLDQKEIDEVKKKYAAIQAEDDKYLDSLQKSIEKQRKLRDQAKSYDDLEKQEKRLALLERDTSGANASEIAALREQIKDARQSLVDTEQDNIVDSISEKNTKRKEQMDEETQFLQNVMDERTYDMQYYLDKARDIVDAAINGDAGAFQQMLEIMKRSEEAFFKVTKEAQDEWAEGLKSEFTKADGWKELTTKGFDAVGESIDGVKGKMQTWLDTDIGKSTFSTTMHNLEDYLKGVKLDGAFETMSSKIKDTINWLEDLKNKVESLPNVEKDIVYKVRIEGDGYGDYPEGRKSGYIVYDSNRKVIGLEEDENKAKNIAYGSGGNYKFVKYLDDYAIGQELTEEQRERINRNNTFGSLSGNLYSTTYGEPLNENSSVNSSDLSDEIKKRIEGNLVAAENDATKWKPAFLQELWTLLPKYKLSVDQGTLLIEYANSILAKFKDFYTKDLTDINNWTLLNKNNYILSDLFDRYHLSYKTVDKFANGGLVDYTGLAWVDGTKSDPEAFLSADDVRNLRTLTEVLSTVLSVPSNTPSVQIDKPTNSGDTNIEIHLDIDKIDSDYDVNDMLELMADKIAEASEGQVNIIRK